MGSVRLRLHFRIDGRKTNEIRMRRFRGLQIQTFRLNGIHFGIALSLSLPLAFESVSVSVFVTGSGHKDARDRCDAFDVRWQDAHIQNVIAMESTSELRFEWGRTARRWQRAHYRERSSPMYAQSLQRTHFGNANI